MGDLGQFHEYLPDGPRITAEDRARVEALLRCAPDMRYRDWRFWADFLAAGGSFEQEISHYARRWARLMQLWIEKGEPLRDIRQSTSRDADFGDFGNPVRASVGKKAAEYLLYRTWFYGGELWRLCLDERNPELAKD